ncbi:hypothetical protein [Micromonospora carbonacea]|uniref:hypothetical protein n=1 Tax=Micromonospora carbonacea TaxID=47853 RepID=UPI003D75D8A6
MWPALADAEDAVQETYIRRYRLGDADRRQINSPRAWLIKTASRIGLDMPTTARARREHDVGEWLPEPIPTPGTWTSHHDSDPIDPAERVSLDESVSMALLREELVNGELGLVATGVGRTLAVISLSHQDGKIDHVWAVRNPQKLEAWHTDVRTPLFVAAGANGVVVGVRNRPDGDDSRGGDGSPGATPLPLFRLDVAGPE